jgi:putative aldouronate transport system substrate-binding protein
MKNLSRMLALMLASLMVFGLAACGGGSEPAATQAPAASTQEPSAETQAPAVEEPAAEPAGFDNGIVPPDVTAKFADVTHELSWYVNGWAEQQDLPVIEAAMNDRLTELGYPGLTVKINGLDWGPYPDKVNSAIFAGEAFDMAYAPDWAINYWDGLAAGAFLPWDPYVEYIPEYYDNIKDWIPRVVERGPDGEYRLYRNFAIKEFASVPSALRFNKTVSDKLGITEGLYNLKSIDELPQYFDKFLEAYPDAMPFVAIDANNLAYTFVPRGVRVELTTAYFDDNTETYTAGILEPWGKEYVDLLRSWRAAGYIPAYEDTATTAGELFTKFGPESFLAYVNTGKPGDEDELNAAGFERDGFMYGETFLVEPVLGKDNILGVPFVLSKTSKNPEAAAFIYALICTDPVLTNYLNFGIEGQHYTKDAEGAITPVSGTKYWPSLQWELGNRMIQAPLVTEPKNLGQLYDEFNRDAFVPKNDGFALPDLSGEFSVDTFNAQRDAVHAQYLRSIIVGSITDAEYEDAKAKLLSGGLQEYIDLHNKYYQEWKASK